MLKEILQHKNIILASGSPRRQQFFKDMDIPFSIQLKEIEEVYPNHLKAEEITNYLAELKAKAFEGSLQENDILITSDTIVWLHGNALGKPKDKADAVAMLQKLSNQSHEVITSVCLTSTAKTEVFHCTTQVTFTALSDDAILYYLDQYQPFDKAGSYGIQDWIGLIGISKIEGSYTNVVGLPTELVYKKLFTYV
ncbi:MAG: septum formation protein Maf [Flavobacterium sp.]|nr:septum formation protein Maf [Flavobacterium sp.]